MEPEMERTRHKSKDELLEGIIKEQEELKRVLTPLLEKSRIKVYDNRKTTKKI